MAPWTEAGFFAGRMNRGEAWYPKEYRFAELHWLNHAPPWAYYPT